jgi:hypothetical protein
MAGHSAHFDVKTSRRYVVAEAAVNAASATGGVCRYWVDRSSVMPFFVARHTLCELEPAGEEQVAQAVLPPGAIFAVEARGAASN